MVKLVIFDLDGTLCNTICDLADAVNYALTKRGYPTHSVEEIQNMVGSGIKNLVTRSMPEAERYEDNINLTKEFFFEYYKVHYADKTVAYDGIAEMLETLKAKNIKLAVCTNKEDTMAKSVVKKLFDGTFSLILGQSDNFPLKPSPDSSLYIMETLGAGVGETVFIGDSGVDIKTAKNTGLESIGVSWGFRDKQELIDYGCEHIAESPYDIIKLLEV